MTKQTHVLDITQINKISDAEQTALEKKVKDYFEQQKGLFIQTLNTNSSISNTNKFIYTKLYYVSSNNSSGHISIAKIKNKLFLGWASELAEITPGEDFAENAEYFMKGTAIPLKDLCSDFPNLKTLTVSEPTAKATTTVNNQMIKTGRNQAISHLEGLVDITELENLANQDPLCSNDKFNPKLHKAIIATIKKLGFKPTKTQIKRIKGFEIYNYDRNSGGMSLHEMCYSLKQTSDKLGTTTINADTKKALLEHLVNDPTTDFDAKLEEAKNGINNR